MVVGRGLESLIPSKKTVHQKPSQGESVFLIDVDAIQPNPFQPRREFDREALKDLARSIGQHGILQPLAVRKIEEETKTGTQVMYQLIAGERRLRAAKMAGLPRVPVVVREHVADGTSLELSLIENVQREDLNALERARAFKRLLDDFELTQEDIAKRIGKSRELVANAVRLLGLPKVIQESILRNTISEGHARAILAIDGEDKQFKLFEEINRGRMNVREAEQAARALKHTRGRSAPVREASQERADLEQQIKEALGVPETRITHSPGKESGTISIRFLTWQQLRELAQRLTK